MYKPVRSICALFLMSFLIGSGVAPSYANSTAVTTPAEEEEVLANGNDFETDFTLSDVPAGTDYEISINGLTFLPPATGTAPDVIAPMGGGSLLKATRAQSRRHGQPAACLTRNRRPFERSSAVLSAHPSSRLETLL